MRKIGILCLCLWLFLLPASAVSFATPEVPDSGSDLIADELPFGEALLHMAERGFHAAVPDFRKAVSVGCTVMAAVMLLQCIQCVTPEVKGVCEVSAATVISVILLTNSNAMIQLGSKTIGSISDYGKLLLPVMTAAMAAEGGITGSAALYAGTVLFGSILNRMISRFLMPMVYVYLALSVAGSAMEEPLLKNLRDLIKTSVSWCLKTLLTVFTSYMTITGVVSGATDAATLKATKVTISSVVPIVGGVLSDASEAVLVSAKLAKNAAGIYGILALLAVFLVPFLRIGIHYLVLKITGSLCALFGNKSATALILDFSTALGLLLAITAGVCLLQLISTVCFLKGVSL